MCAWQFFKLLLVMEDGYETVVCMVSVKVRTMLSENVPGICIVIAGATIHDLTTFDANPFKSTSN